jgi:hypothetical protein
MNKHETHRATTKNHHTELPTPDKGHHYDRRDFTSVNHATQRIRGHYTGKISAAQKAAIRTAVVRHNARQIGNEFSHRTSPTTTPAERMEAKLRELAVWIGEHHANVAPLYKSERGSVVYGERQFCTDYNAYSKSYGHPAQWYNAGARIEGTAGNRVIILQDYKGRDHAVYPVRALWKLYISGKLTDAGMLDGDLYSVITRTRKNPNGGTRIITAVTRYHYDVLRAKFVKTGYARLMPDPRGEGRKYYEYYEHGASVREIQEAHARKVALYEAKQRQNKAINAYNQSDEATRRKAERAARLIARMCPNLQITMDDARAVGFCDAGIKAYCQRRHLPTDFTDAATLRRAEKLNPPTSSTYSAARVIQRVAERTAVELVINHRK